MSTQPINDGGPAYPTDAVSQNQATGETIVHQPYGGLTIRDYFAAHFMQRAQVLSEYREGGWDFENAAHCAYEMADAMLRARQS